MRQNVNYIEHHKSVNIKMSELDLNSTHISLYNALFLIWNECGFDTQLSINRNDMMKLSKIGSANTYTKCLKDLDKSGLITYKPSYNPMIGSKVDMYRFDKGTDKGTGKSSSKGCGNGTDNSTATLSKLLNKETIKLLNKKEDCDFLNNYLLEILGDKENIIKVLKSDSKKVAPKKVFNFRKELIENGFKESLVIDWLKVRKTKKATNTQTALNGFLKQVSESNLSKDEVLTMCVEKDWKGFNNSWLNKKEPTSTMQTVNNEI